MGLVKYEFYNIYRDICLVIRILIILFYWLLCWLWINGTHSYQWWT